MIKLTLIEDNFGDKYLGCPNCKEHLYIPLTCKSNYIFDNVPKQCTGCGEEFDWSAFKTKRSKK